MAAKSSDWRPGPTVCRCCLTEGCYKDISTEYFWMGKREVYSEMLLETFDLTVAYAQTGGPNSNSRLICEPCISRLRDACDFKRQVVECERVFHQHLAGGSDDIEGSSETVLRSLLEKDVKQEMGTVKVEIEAKMSDDEDFGDHGASPPDDDDDDLDDQPLTKLATKVPKKETVDLMDLMDNAKPEKRKSTTKVKTTPSKKVKKKETPKPSASKAVKPPAEKKKKAGTTDPAKSNARLLLKHTTALPFKTTAGNVMACLYCRFSDPDPSVFIRHMEKHPTYQPKAFIGLPSGYNIKTEISNLQCRICYNSYEDLSQISEHLKVHNVFMDISLGFGVIPFILNRSGDDKWVCAVCSRSCPSFPALIKHTVTHYSTFHCTQCDSSYSSLSYLKNHVLLKHEGGTKEVSCRKCRRTFPSLDARAQHNLTEKTCMRYSCITCGEKFPIWEFKQRHMIEEHGLTKKTYPCTECDKVFKTHKTYRDHFTKTHTQDYIVCSHCGMRFGCQSNLKKHLVYFNIQ